MGTKLNEGLTDGEGVLNEDDSKRKIGRMRTSVYDAASEINQEVNFIAICDFQRRDTFCWSNDSDNSLGASTATKSDA